MTLKAVKQLTNIAWIIGGVSAVSGGYSYYNSHKEKRLLTYTPKEIKKISTIDDIEDFEAAKGCRFVYYSGKGRKEGWIPKYNDWFNGGVRSARDYVSRSEGEDKKKLEEEVIKITEEDKERCKQGEIIYKEIGKKQ